jgi:hypothetical protein
MPSLSWCPSLAQLLHLHDYWLTACSCFSVRCLALSGGSRRSDTQEECQWRTAKSVDFETTVSFSAWVTAVPNSSSILVSSPIASWMLRLIDQGSRHRWLARNSIVDYNILRLKNLFTSATHVTICHQLRMPFSKFSCLPRWKWHSRSISCLLRLGLACRFGLSCEDVVDELMQVPRLLQGSRQPSTIELYKFNLSWDFQVNMMYGTFQDTQIV